MKNRFIFFIGVFFVFHSVFACDVMDDTGQTLHLQQPAKRIISLAPDLTELLFSAGAGDRIVGVMRGSDYPAEAKKIPIVASYNALDSEAILALHPDLILTWTDVGFISQLKKLNIPVYFSHQKKILDIPETLLRLGCLTGEASSAKKSAQLFTEKYLDLKKKYSRKKIIRVFYQIGSKPLMTVGNQSWINEMMRLCGGENIFSGLVGAAPEINIESVVVANPEVIFGDEAKIWRDWKQLAAVKNQKIFSINPDLVERAGGRLVEGADIMCHAIDRVRAKQYA